MINYPPYYKPVLTGDTLHKLWLEFWDQIYFQLQGEAQIEGYNLTGENIDITNLKINNVTWPANAEDGQVLRLTEEDVVDFVDPVAADTGIMTGEMELTIWQTAREGYIMADDGTIGNSASSATTRANDDCEDLFIALWNASSDADCPVSGGRGASASADFTANKTINLPLIKDKLIGVAGAGAGLTTRTANQSVGSNTCTITSDNIVVHTHTAYGHNSATAGPYTKTVLRFAYTSIFGDVDTTISNVIDYVTLRKSGTIPNDPVTPMPIRQPSTYFNIEIKL